MWYTYVHEGKTLKHIKNILKPNAQYSFFSHITKEKQTKWEKPLTKPSGVSQADWERKYQA